jgi:thioredoxin 1
MAEGIVHTTDADFEKDVIQSALPALVDFWAPWCGPCQMIAPVLEELARTYEGRLKIVKVNIDDCGETAQRYVVQAIPTLLLFKDGRLSEREVGFVAKTKLAALIDKHVPPVS